MLDEVEEEFRRLQERGIEAQNIRNTLMTRNTLEKQKTALEKIQKLMMGNADNIMGSFRHNKTLNDLEDELGVVQSFFKEDSDKGFRELDDESHHLNKNGHFAYVLSRREHYENVQRQMKSIGKGLDSAHSR